MVVFFKREAKICAKGEFYNRTFERAGKMNDLSNTFVLITKNYQ